MKILGIESSCDDTATAIVSSDRQILSNKVFSQKNHTKFGGVVPEIAARGHLKNIENVLYSSLHEANCTLGEIDAIAVTKGPGLTSSLLVGIGFARSIAFFAKKPIIAVNHLEGHLLTARLSHYVQFPFLCLLLSGGHTQIVWVEKFRKYKILANTLDDSIGECFDKVARELKLPYPGGPQIEKHAQNGDIKRFNFPRSLCKSNNLDFSFSGLKTAVKREIEKIYILDNQNIADICASFQHCIQEILAYKLNLAIQKIKKEFGYQEFSIVAGGGVVANNQIKNQIKEIAAQHQLSCFFPDPKLCTDNAAMITWVGVEILQNNAYKKEADWGPLARWSVEDLCS